MNLSIETEIDVKDLIDQVLCQKDCFVVLDSILDNMIGPWRDALTQIVERAQAEGKIDGSMSSEAVARVLLSTWQGLVLQKALDPDLEVADYLDVVKAIYRGTLSKLSQGDGQKVAGDVKAT